jgi:hypothetical protein
MRVLRIILWIQLLTGIVGGYISFRGVHSGALGMEWASVFQRELQRISSSPDYREPPPVRGYSYAGIAERMQRTARDRAEKAAYCLLLSGALAVFATAGLWFSRPRK